MERNNLSKTYKTVDLQFFNNAIYYLPSNVVSILNNSTYSMYMRYLENLNRLSKDDYNYYLYLIKAKNNLENYNLDGDDLFAISLYERYKNFSIDIILKAIENGELTKEEFIKANEMLLIDGKNLSKPEFEIPCKDNYEYRKCNDFIVGTVGENGKIRKIHYFPIDYREIEKASEIFLDYFNDSNNETTQNLFIKPFMIHGLIAGAQFFENGNTRLGRILEHAKLYTITKSLISNDLSSPAIFASKEHFSNSTEYRNIIKKLVERCNDESWNEWMLFNMVTMQNQIASANENITKILKR